jgi:hypothetical protein
VAGTGYTVGDAINLDAPATTNGVQATAEVSQIGASDSITEITITNKGSGYTGVPAAAFTGGAGASGTAVIASTSTHFDLTGTNTGTLGGDGFTITPTVTPSPDFQANFHRTSTTLIKGHLDPGTTSAPGSAGPEVAPTKSTFSSPEKSVLPTINASGNVCLVVEWADAFMVLVEDSTNVFYASGYHAGIILEPLVQDYIALGTDGLGILGGVPSGGTAIATMWLRSTVGGTHNTFRINNTETEATDWQNTDVNPLPYQGTSTTNRLHASGYYGVCPSFRWHSTTQRWYGVHKYVWIWYPNKTFKTRLQNPSGGEDLYMCLGGHSTGITTGPLVIPWPDNTDPDTF